MNERILELMTKAGFDEQALFESDFDDEQNIKITMDIFAELIVRECVQTLIDNTPERYTNESAEEDWDKGYDRAMRDCVHHIQEHFGVEE